MSKEDRVIDTFESKFDEWRNRKEAPPWNREEELLDGGEYIPPVANSTSFRLEPEQVQRAGFRIDYLANLRGKSQWLCIEDVEGDRWLFFITEEDGLEGYPLGERTQSESDRI